MKKKKLLLLGSTGMAGHVAYYYLNNTNKYEITNVVFRNKLTDDSIIVDICDKLTIEKLIREINPQIILNCIGVLIKGSHLQPDNGIYINAYFPHQLERLAAECDAKLIHISSDCVFSGVNGNYLENDVRDADDIYGKSKALGEVINNKDLTIRTSLLGPELKTKGEGLFNWFMHTKGKVNGFTEVFWGGVTTFELAKAIDIAIEQNLTGLVHLTNGDKISKYELLNLIKNIWKKNDVIVVPHSETRKDLSLMRSNNFKYLVPTYKKMLEEQYEWTQSNNYLYQNLYK